MENGGQCWKFSKYYRNILENVGCGKDWKEVENIETYWDMLEMLDNI